MPKILIWPKPYREVVSATRFQAIVRDWLRDIRTPGASKAVRVAELEIAVSWTAMDYVIAEAR